MEVVVVVGCAALFARLRQWLCHGTQNTIITKFSCVVSADIQ